MYNYAAVLLSVATLLVCVPSVWSCHNYLHTTYKVSPAPGQPTNVTLDFKTSKIVQRIEIELYNCPNGHRNMQSNILLEYIDGSDITRTPRKRLVAFSMNQQQWKLYYEFDRPLYAESIFLSIGADPQCAQAKAYGCSSTDLFSFSQCNNGGTSVGSDMCACAKGFMGKTCDDPASGLAGDDFTFLKVWSNDKINTNTGVFLNHGNIAFRYNAINNHAHYENALHMYNSGGHIHLDSKHPPLHSFYPHFYSTSVSSVVNGHISKGFSQTATIVFSSGHDHHHAVHLYNTHHDIDSDNPGSSLVYQDHVLQMNVHTGSRQYELSVPWHPSSKHRVTSSFSPQYGCSIYVDGEFVDSASDSVPAQQQTCPPTNLCIGSCSYKYNYYNHCYNNCPHANYWIGPVYTAGMSLPQLILNNMLPAIGLDPHAMATRPALTPTPSQATPPPPTARPTTTITTTTTVPPPMTKAPTTAPATQPPPTPRPTTATTTTTVPPPPKTKAPTTAPATQPSSTPRPTTTTTTTQQPVTKPPTTPFVFSATGGIQTTGTSATQAGPVCYSCTKTSSDGTCSTLKSCQAGEVCAAYHDPTGYTHRCLDKAICSAAKSLTHSSCWTCCDYSLCNKQCAPVVKCEDTNNCAMLVSTGYNVCSDQRAATVECKKTCGLC